jgi:hypothetical protein
VRLDKICLSEKYSRVCIGIHLSNNFPIPNGMKQFYMSRLLLLKFALEYVIRKVEKSQVGLKLSGTHQLLSYADDTNLLGGNINTVKRKQ